MISRTGAVETYRCEQCGNEEYIHFSISPDELYAAQKGTVEVCIDWREQDADIKTIMKLRRLVPELKGKSLDDVRNSLHVGQSFSLGRYFSDQADDLKAKLEEIGLSARCV
ncbi:hypothetical protein sS8_3560 [Methylocaldum marinum]|uniref:Uncharacterized protein n=1 Tax=Methylocaldum marinum TaxID=1432792 RepID=A0A250KV60_9GAMM|nr:hypothetical protein sS8_3560 [Methylocaldum marinum]